MPDTLLTPELLRRLEQFQLLAARRAKSSLRGERRSRARGQSVEFADYRDYTLGDDLRQLDWNVYARLEELFVRLTGQPEQAAAAYERAAELDKPLTMLLFGMINWMFTWLKPGGSLSHDDMAPIVADLFLGGLGAVRAPPTYPR